MSLLATINTAADVKPEVDSLGGFGPLDSGLYIFTVEMAYLAKTAKGAVTVTLHMKSDKGQNYTQTFYVTTGTDKGCVNYSVKQSGEKSLLKGFTLIDGLCLLTTGKPLGEQTEETKTVKIYDYDQKKEVPTQVPVLVDLLGREIIAGVHKKIVDKNVKNADGVYVPSGETRTENEVDKFFRVSDRRTVAEILAEQEEALFVDTWDKKWTGQVIDRSTKVTAKPGAGAPAAAGGSPVKSLFTAG